MMKILGKKLHDMKETIEAYCICGADCGSCSCSCGGGCITPSGSYEASQYSGPSGSNWDAKSDNYYSISRTYNM